MSDLDTFATIRGTGNRLRDLIRLSAGNFHDTVYLRVGGDEVNVITQTNGRQVMTFATFDGLDVIDGEGEAIIPTGISNDARGMLDYLDIADGPDKIELELLGQEDDSDHPRLASYWRANGGLEATVRLSTSQKDLNKVPWGMPARFDDKGRWVSRAALTDGEIDPEKFNEDKHVPPTRIQTTSNAIVDGIINPAEFMDLGEYPITVDDGEFRVDVQDQDGDDQIAGTVQAESVEGPDVSRVFDEGFKEVFASITGPVTLATAPYDGDGPAPPLVVTQDHRNDRTIRHVIGPFAE